MLLRLCLAVPLAVVVGIYTTSTATPSLAAAQVDCGCTDDAPFVRDPVPIKPTRSDLTQATNDLSRDCATAAIASRKLAMIGDPSSVAPLIRALRHKSCRVRTAAADALGSLRDRRAIAPLISALSDPDPRVRSSAGWSLANIPDSSAVTALLTALTDTNKHVRQAAAYSLGAIGDPRAAPALTRALHDPQKDVREVAARSIGQLRRAPPIAERTESPAERCSWDGWLPPAVGRERLRRSTHLDAAGVSRLTALSHAAGKDERMLAAQGLAAAQDPASLQALMALTSDADPVIQEQAIRALGRRGERTATATVARFAQSSNSHLRQASVWSLGQLQDPSGLNTVVAAARDSSKHVRNEAAWALGLIAGSRAIAPTLELTRDENSQIRLAAACSLGIMRPDEPRVRAALTRLTSDADPTVREVARWTLTRF